ncbi:MAG: DUF177 domain-containing protein [Burkholderiales bacterium]|nr:DUF177 domain-containing protein [Burkholderiales bacterium]MDE1926337.1 DUF177 domain-containing protein [Burkholderiales bacterium]MDE2159986.1 DUF177 domain-containing protein [Burkholderiales bacterium]MDE2504420.1 DUF177 domain-containing protein [Burkholderiales bacterium]
MAERNADPRALDLAAFCRLGGALAGRWPLAGMPRLVASLLEVHDAAAADWSAQGSELPVTGGRPEVWLHLRGQATVTLECQRCLQPVDAALAVDRRFRFVDDADEAARLDEESEDDVLQMPQRLDLHELLEDELILALPIVPRHAVCPQALPLAPEAAPAQDRPNPFAALAALRGRLPPGETE